ncbi:two-component system OmpR family response regulator [Paraburkholderia sp. GAS333]
MAQYPAACRRWSTRTVELLNKRPRVLVIDDYGDSADALAALLTYEGMEARVAKGCDEALACVHVWVPDLVIVDIKLVGRDGFATAKALRDYLPTENLGIVAYTSFDESNVLKMSDNPQVLDGYCRKGNPGALLDLIAEIWK